MTELRLGLFEKDYNFLVENVSIVFHVAASVRFDESIKDATIMNVRGTREVVQLAKQMKNLKVGRNKCTLNNIDWSISMASSFLSVHQKRFIVFTFMRIQSEIKIDKYIINLEY